MISISDSDALLSSELVAATIRDALADVTVKVDLSSLRLALAKNTELTEAIAEAVLDRLGASGRLEPAVTREGLEAALDRLESRLPNFHVALADVTSATRSAVTTGTGEVGREIGELAARLDAIAARVESLAQAPAEPPLARSDFLDGLHALDERIATLAPGPLVTEVKGTVKESVKDSVSAEVAGLLELFKSELDERYHEAAADRDAFRSDIREVLEAVPREDHLGRITAKLDALGEVPAQLSEVQAALDPFREVPTQLSGLRAALDPLREVPTELSKARAEVRARFEALDGVPARLDALSDLPGELAKIRDEIADLGAYRDEVTLLPRQFDALRQEVTRLPVQIGALHQEVTELPGELAAVRERLEDVTGQLAELRQGSATTELAGIREELQRLRRRVTLRARPDGGFLSDDDVARLAQALRAAPGADEARQSMSPPVEALEGGSGPIETSGGGSDPIEASGGGSGPIDVADEPTPPAGGRPRRRWTLGRRRA